MNCRHARRDLRRRIDESLDIQRELELEAHLSECSRCRGFDRRAQTLEETLARLPEPPLAGLDVEHAVAVVRSRRQADRGEQARKSKRTQWIRWAVPLAAGLVLWAGLDILSGGPDSTTEPGADAVASAALMAPPGEELVSAQEELTSTSDGPALDPGQPIDHDRLAQVRAEVRAHLAQLGGSLPPDPTSQDLAALAEGFDLATVGLARGDWPVLRIVEGVLAEPEPLLARTAARYLGLRGSLSSVRHLRQALKRDDLARDAALALGDMGAAGLDGLAQAVDVPLARAVAIEGLVRVGSVPAAGYLSLAYERDADPVLLTALGAMGAEALPEVLALHVRGLLDEDLYLKTLGGIEGAGAWCVEQLEARGFDGEPAVVLGASALEPEHTARWIEAHLHNRDYRELTRRFLPTLPGVAGVRSLIRLHSDSRLSSQDLAQATSAAQRLDGERFAVVALERGPGTLKSREVLLELLLAAPEDAGLLALSVCAGDTELPQTERTTAALRLGESDLPDALPVLARVFSQCSSAERNLAAACLLGIDRLGGLQAVEPLLQGGPRRTYQNILALLQSSSGDEHSAPSIYKLARELRSFLSARDRMTPSISS